MNQVFSLSMSDPAPWAVHHFEQSCTRLFESSTLKGLLFFCVSHQAQTAANDVDLYMELCAPCRRLTDRIAVMMNFETRFYFAKLAHRPLRKDKPCGF